VFAGGLALILPTLFITSVAVPSWTGRHALLALKAAVGLPVAFSLLRTHARRAASAGLAFAAWTLLSFVASPGHTTAFWGLFGWGTGALFVLALVACWAIGTATVGPGARWIENALLAAAVLNAALAVLQSLVDLG